MQGSTDVAVPLVDGSRYPQARGRKPTVRDGLVFLAMHDASVNRLTHPSSTPPPANRPTSTPQRDPQAGPLRDVTVDGVGAGPGPTSVHLLD